MVWPAIELSVLAFTQGRVSVNYGTPNPPKLKKSLAKIDCKIDKKNHLQNSILKSFAKSILKSILESIAKSILETIEESILETFAESILGTIAGCTRIDFSLFLHLKDRSLTFLTLLRWLWITAMKKIIQN